MDTDLTNPNLKSITTPLTEAFDSQKVEEYEQEEEEEDDDEDGERSSLLSPRKGGMSKKRSKSKKSRRKVQWNDRNGNKLAEVREFQPSDVSDTDDEDLDSCICSVM